MRGGERIDPLLEESRDIVAMLGDQVPGDQKDPGFVAAIHDARIASIRGRFHRAPSRNTVARLCKAPARFDVDFRSALIERIDRDLETLADDPAGALEMGTPAGLRIALADIEPHQ